MTMATGPAEPPHKADVLARACAALSAGDADTAKAIIDTDYPLSIGTKAQRKYTLTEAMRTFYRDGFLDRYSGTRLVHPGALRTLSIVMPREFPAHPNGKLTETHFALWELFPTIDHLHPVARGGADDASNWVTTSMLRNSAKAHWTLSELGWSLHDAGDVQHWDGLSSWFIDYLADHPDLASSSAYLRRWLRASREVLAERA
ncbi:HNH endonuclease [Rhodococcoides kroppenstedtii]|uniref:HNH endonuclease n=2 Tax=Mycobacteriales TaxID=85007 RepID=A0ABS7P101_9NOCA|nr:HNH endonuclease [Rhodococcus kroppenstedtii]MBY6315184.1 HNH endonuclease [Rhodococcus kroppenstedtii]MBY6322792.1 HNH endonuclease [Rhodococcus kroppenstedtii]MBY6401515.1 HNH endonuclease [Rhodococcus kroppenstedtii]